jgi:hypothetical protein
MAKELRLYIEKCDGCPYSVYNSDRDYSYCSRVIPTETLPKVISNTHIIPKWCPLPDIKK